MSRRPTRRPAGATSRPASRATGSRWWSVDRRPDGRFVTLPAPSPPFPVILQQDNHGSVPDRSRSPREAPDQIGTAVGSPHDVGVAGRPDALPPTRGDDDGPGAGDALVGRAGDGGDAAVDGGVWDGRDDLGLAQPGADARSLTRRWPNLSRGWP